jgi:hypothetical protein
LTIPKLATLSHFLSLVLSSLHLIDGPEAKEVSPWVRRVDCESKEHRLALPDMLNQCHCTLNVTFLAALSEVIVPLERVQ